MESPHIPLTASDANNTAVIEKPVLTMKSSLLSEEQLDENDPIIVAEWPKNNSSGLIFDLVGDQTNRLPIIYSFT